MKSLKRILLPAAVCAGTLCGVLGMGAPAVSQMELPSTACCCDTVVYPPDGYKLRRALDLEAYSIADSLLEKGKGLNGWDSDTLPHLSARDTIKVPDSLRLTDPFRYKYYVALVDSLTHVEVRDSLLHRVDSLKKSSTQFKLDSLFEESLRDSTFASLDSADRFKLDSLYYRDSTIRAKAAFEKWYNALSKADRKKYDLEQLTIRKMAEMDSLKKAQEEKQAIRDSIIKFKPRILQTFALPDSMQYKRIIEWTLDQDFHKMDVGIADTSFNYHYYDFPFQRNDVNATWLGEAGTPVQYYNFFKRDSGEGVEFYDALESWSFSPSTVKHFNSKTPHTELGYFGSLLAGDDKESDVLHLFTTQNITPALNFHLLYDSFGTGGELQNSKVKNKTASIGVNYLGKKYLMHTGFISNTVERGESGGIVQNYADGTTGRFWIRDTTVEAREIRVAMNEASSTLKKRTLYLDQQLRIPFNFIYKLKARRDSTFTFNPDSLDKDMATAFIGHSTEFSSYERNYTDKIGSGDTYGRAFYSDPDGNYRWRYDMTASDDRMAVTKLDNKVFIKLQPWTSESIVSKLNLGIGDCYKNYFDSTYLRPTARKENSAYVYAGAEGQFRKYFFWDAKADYTFAGTDFGNFGLSANASVCLYPFRRDRNSPVALNARFETSLKEPTYYQKHLNLNHYSWDNEFSKISTTRIQGSIAIPRWKMDASLGYALLDNNIYFDSGGMARQNTDAMSVLSASLRKNFQLGPLHFDNQALLQTSSNQDVVPVPLLALNLRYYVQFGLGRDHSGRKVMQMQIGANGFYNTEWYTPGWNPNVGVFYNQKVNRYENGPYLDAFINMQWKKACVFVKMFNVGMGWPLKHADYFTADHYIVPQRAFTGIKFGILWPFYISPVRNNRIGSASDSGMTAASAGGDSKM